MLANIFFSFNFAGKTVATSLKGKNFALPLCRCMKSLKIVSPQETHPDHLRLEDYSESYALDKVNEDLSVIAPHLQNTFNFAAYVNKSESLQNLVKLGIDLSKIEKKNQELTKYVMSLDFDKDVKPHVFFLKEYVEQDQLGNYLTKNISILREDLKDLEVRINYLIWKRFKKDEIKQIISKNPFWLMFSTQRIDKRLGFFQEQFQLEGSEIRYLASKQPKIVTYNLQHITVNSFVVKEEMGFNNEEIKKLLLDKPRLWMLNQLHLVRRFDYVHNIMKIPHQSILDCPNILTSRKFRIEQRHRFLDSLGRAQYDPTKENYVPLKCLYEGNDVDFCRDVAKCTVDDFNTFLKTL